MFLRLICAVFSLTILTLGAARAETVKGTATFEQRDRATADGRVRGERPGGVAG